MSVSVDDLVASFNSNHIGQEAMDLASLHAQLAQALCSHPSSSAQSVPSRAAPSNTPLACTPSSSFSWESGDFGRARSSSVASVTQRWGLDERKLDLDEMDEDERMVEELLFSSPTMSHFSHSYQNVPSSALPSESFGILSRQSGIPQASSSYEPELSSPNTSLFATTDPFFAAQLQAAQNPTPSFFAQAGRPSAHSPFMIAQQLQSAYGHSHAHHPSPSEVDPHYMFAAPPAAFT